MDNTPQPPVCKFADLPLGAYFKLPAAQPRFADVVYRKTSLDTKWRGENTPDNAQRLDTRTPAWFVADQTVTPVDPPALPTHQLSLWDEFTAAKADFAADVERLAA